MITTISKHIDISIDRQQVLQTLGYRAELVPPARISSLVNEYAENALHLLEPSYSWDIKYIKSINGERVVIDDSIIFKSNVIARLLEQCERVAIFVLTVGSHLEEMVSALSDDGLMLQATVLDAIGSNAAEKLADSVQERIGEIARAQGLCISQRFSPGYCDWPVNEQKMIFRAIDSKIAGVRLTKGCLMLPRKSISGIIGIGPCGNADNYNPCKTCEKQDNCVGRR